jgi:hypothetical protein
LSGKRENGLQRNQYYEIKNEENRKPESRRERMITLQNKSLRLRIRNKDDEENRKIESSRERERIS